MLALPSTFNLNVFAVVPIPTPTPSTQKIDDPDPTFSVQSPGEVVAIPTLSKIETTESCSKLIVPTLFQSLFLV